MFLFPFQPKLLLLLLFFVYIVFILYIIIIYVTRSPNNVASSTFAGTFEQLSAQHHNLKNSIYVLQSASNKILNVYIECCERPLITCVCLFNYISLHNKIIKILSTFFIFIMFAKFASSSHQ